MVEKRVLTHLNQARRNIKNLPPVRKLLFLVGFHRDLSISEEISMKTRRTAEINSIEFGVLWRCALGIGHLFRIHACHDQTLLRWEIFQFGLHQWTTQWGSHTRMPLSVPGHSFLRWHWGQLVVGTSKSALQVLKIQSPGARTRNTQYFVWNLPHEPLGTTYPKESFWTQRNHKLEHFKVCMQGNYALWLTRWKKVEPGT